MIDLTPLDVRNKNRDFRKGMRGYDVQEVDIFLELVAERLEALVRENLQLKHRVETLQEQVTSQTGREQAVQEALVTAQELRSEVQAQAKREAKLILDEAEAGARRLHADADFEVRRTLREAQTRLDATHEALERLERRRARFLRAFRKLLQNELEGVDEEEARQPVLEPAVTVEVEVPSTPPPGPSPDRTVAAAATADPKAPTDAAEREHEDPIPLDASVEELQAAHDARSGADGELAPEDRADGDLSLSLEEESKSGS